MHFYLGLKHKHTRTDRGEELNVTHGQDKSYLKILDRVTLVAGIAGPFTAIPQIYKIFSTHIATGVSATSWILMFVTTAPWIFYGIAHKDKTIIASFTLWQIANLLVIIGAIMYH
jgi:uncharacterized protein with PQ loop repeat